MTDTTEILRNATSTALPSPAGEAVAPHLHGGRHVPAVRTTGISKSFSPGKAAISGISLTIDEGETVALIGPNGAGKSTLLRSLVGLHPLDDGEVSVFGHSFFGSPDRHTGVAIRSQVGFVFQQHGLVRRASVLTNVIHGKLGLPGGWRGWRQSIAPQAWRDEAMEALHIVGMAEKCDARADQLSGGQSQRVAIARALVRKPRLLIADEPAASLDPAAGNEVMSAFFDISKALNMTLVFTSHDMEHALEYSRRVIALRNGRICLDAERRDLGHRDLDRIFHD